LQPVETHRIGAPHLAQEAALENAPKRLAGVIGPEGDEEAGRDGILPKECQEPRNTFLQADPGINVHFDSNL
jgi:hypothetical protein